MARITIDPQDELEAFIRDQAARFGDRPGEYLNRLVRAAYLAHQGDLGGIGLLLPSDLLRDILIGRGASVPASLPHSPPAGADVNVSAIDDALDDYT